MKKIVLTLAFMLICSMAHAQIFTKSGSTDTKVFEWGVKAGLNLSDLSNSDVKTPIVDDYTPWRPGVGVGEKPEVKYSVNKSKMKPSFYIGAFMEIKPFGGLLGIQPEINYSRQGNYYKHEGEKRWNRLNYIDVPVIVKLYFTNALSLDVGPQFGFLLNAKSVYKTNGVSVKRSFSDAYKKFDVSVAFGLSYCIIDHIDVTARYNLGMIKVNKEGDKGQKNRVIQIGAGYRF